MSGHGADIHKLSPTNSQKNWEDRLKTEQVTKLIQSEKHRKGQNRNYN